MTGDRTQGGSEVRLSVVVPCWNGAAVLAELLESLSEQKWDGEWEVVVADNGSTDGSREVALRFRERIGRLRVVDASQRKGAAHARNVGAAAARGPWIAFCDSDDVVGEGWLQAIASALESHELVASRFEFEHLNPEWLRHARPDHQTENLQRLWYPPYALHAGGSGLAVRRELHERIGGFDEGLRRLQDTDFCIRAQASGASLVLASDAVLQVRHHPNPRELFRQSRLWAYYNTALYARHGRGQELVGSWQQYRRDWRKILTRVKKLRTRAGRSSLLARVGWQVGLLEGALRFHVPPLSSPSSGDSGSIPGVRRVGNQLFHGTNL